MQSYFVWPIRHSRWLLPLLLLPLAAMADDVKVQAQLVWGTNQSKPAGTNFTELDIKSREKVRQFKWTNYWVVSTTATPIAKGDPKLVNLSEKCAVDLKDLGNGNVEIRLFELKKDAKPKLVKPVQHSLAALKKGEYCIIAGDDKAVWDDAWFVIVSASK